MPDAAQKMMRSLRYFQNGCSWGGFESLCYYMGENEEGRPLIRLHVGLESTDTLIQDIENALSMI